MPDPAGAIEGVASVAVALAPCTADAIVAEQSRPPTVQFIVVAAQVSAPEQVGDDCERTPSLHVTFTLPVAGVVESLTEPDAPCAKVAAEPVQLEPAPLFQFSVPEVHSLKQVVADVLHTPLVQVAVAAPVCEAVESIAATSTPLEVVATDAEQFLPDTVQFTVPAAQGAPVVQVAPESATVPLSQLTITWPVVVGVLSITVVVAPAAIAVTDPVQLLAPCVQFTDCESHPCGTVNVPPLAVPIIARVLKLTISSNAAVAAPWTTMLSFALTAPDAL